MITTAAFLIGCSYEAVHRDKSEHPDSADLLLTLSIFMAFDYLMVSAL